MTLTKRCRTLTNVDDLLLKTFKTINKSIRLAKNIKKFEIIVVDDGSQDGIENKINVIKSRYRNIVFVQNIFYNSCTSIIRDELNILCIISLFVGIYDRISGISPYLNIY